MRAPSVPAGPDPDPQTDNAEAKALAALDAAERLDAEAEEMPEGSPTRASLRIVAEELRAYAAGERAKAALSRQLSDPTIRQILQNANIRVE